MERTLIKDLTKKIDETVLIKGWVDTIRAHGSLVFIDLRDRFGKVQCVAHKSIEDFSKAKELTIESCIALTGKVQKRPSGADNPELGDVGSVEIGIEKIGVVPLSHAILSLPFERKPHPSCCMPKQYQFLKLFCIKGFTFNLAHEVSIEIF